MKARLDSPRQDAEGHDDGTERQFLLGIVVVSCNYERFLAEAIGSAVEQTYSNVEVIVVDDGSTDSSPEIIRSFGGKVRAIFKPNEGETSVVNRGFAESRGDAIIFLDSDDRLDPTVAEEIAAVWQPGLVKVQYGLQIIDAAGYRAGDVRAHLSARLHAGEASPRVCGNQYLLLAAQQRQCVLPRVSGPGFAAAAEADCHSGRHP